MKKIILLLLLIPSTLSAQNYGLQIYNGAKVTLSGPVYLNIAQTNASGIYRNTTTGGIICDNEQSRVNWQVGTATGNYIFPLMSPDGDNVTATVNVGTAGTGSGSVLVSTYHTPANNTPYPTNSDPWFADVTNVWDINAIDNSANVVDRFWLVNYNAYTSNPTATITLKYDAIGGTTDIGALVEADLMAEYWGSNTWQPYDPLLGVADPANDQVASIPTVNFSAPWVLVTKNTPLPVELLNFTFQCGHLDWSTATETNCDYFLIYSSENTNDWALLGQVSGNGNSNTVQYYSFNTDLSNKYFKLVQVDFDGSSEEYGPIYGSCGSNSGLAEDVEIQIYPNPFNEVVYVVCPEPCTLEIYDAIGKLIRTEQIQAFNSIEMSSYANGLYTFSFKGNAVNTSRKVVKNKN